MANASSRQIIDAWAQPVFKDGLLTEAVRVFEQSGSAHLLGQELSAAQLVELMDKAGVDRVTLDVMKLGGVTGWLRAAALAESWGPPASSHTFPEFSAHLLSVTPTCHWLEYLNHVGPILTEPVRIKDGHGGDPLHTRQRSGVE